MESLDYLLNQKSKVKNNKNETRSKIKKCAGYIRVSTEEQAVNPEGSIRSQEERIKQALTFKNSNEEFGTLSHIFTDAGLSGKDMNRPELRRMLKLVSEGEIDLIIVSDLSRLSRSIRDFSQIWEFLQAHHCQLWSLRENFDTSTAAGEMMLYSIANFSQYERKQTAERVSANFQSRASRGLHNGGTIPLGYEVDAEKPGHFKINEKEAETVRAAFLAMLKAGSIAGAAKWLNQNGFTFEAPYRTGGGGSKPRLKTFNVGNLTYLLSNPAYIGIRRYKLKNGKYQESKAAWSAIIDEVTFLMVKSAIEGSKKRKLPSERRYPYLLTGKVFCESCGQGMMGKSAHGRAGKFAYYEHSSQARRESCLGEDVKKVRCNPNRVPAKVLEKRVFEEIEKFLSDPKLSNVLFEKNRKRNEPVLRTQEKEKLNSQIQKIDSKIESLIGRLSELPKHIPATTLYHEIEKLQHEKLANETKRSAIIEQDSKQELGVRPLDYEQFLVRLMRMVKENPSFEMRRAIVGALIHRVEVHTSGFKLGFYIGAGQLKNGEALASPSFLQRNVFLSSGSFCLQNGAPARTRTWDPRIRNAVL